MFLLFAGDVYDPNGGAHDLKGRFESADLAVLAHNPRAFKYVGGWVHILDTETMDVIKTFDNGVWHDSFCAAC